MLPKLYKEFCREIAELIPEERMIRDRLRTLAYGTDASFYRLVPKIVINVENEREVVWILRAAGRRKLSVTFRAAGTSLSGQSVTDSILVRLGEGWQGYKIFDHASKISLEPGVIGSWANCYLSEFGKKIGPDPASIDTAKIGGIVANNASGMCCGVSENSYKTIADMRLVLYDGTVLDTSDDKSLSSFKKEHPEIFAGIGALRDQIAADGELSDRIKYKFKIKNTTGYSLNAFTDFKDPFDIIKHLMVGSEGTLGFISEVVYHTVVEHAHKASALMLFPDIEKACEATITLKRQPVSAVELMDRAALRAVEHKAGMPDEIKGLADGVTALLVETRAESRNELEDQIAEIDRAVASIPKVNPYSFTSVAEEFTRLWNIRKGLFPAVGAVRDTGTTVIIEDVAFPIEKLAAATLDLQGLFVKYHYTEAIIFGHALEGNLHFVFTQAFEEESERERYRKFMNDIAMLVVDKYDGSLKAEHGTGRNMAPFVEMEWGARAYEIMKRVKHLFDPHEILNPGVIINDDKEAHVKNLKPMPAADEIVDKCIECGFCEPVCPSRDITFTPRHRIVGWREISRLERVSSGKRERRKLLKGYRYLGDETCATDGLCSTRCPVDINTGRLIKKVRAENKTAWNKSGAELVADHFAGVTTGIRAGLKAAHMTHKIAGEKFVDGVSKGLRTLSGNRLPMWNRAMPNGASKIRTVRRNPATPLKVVYFTACISRNFGGSIKGSSELSLPDVTISLLEKAGYDILIPEGLDTLCCGMAFSSKGYPEQAEKKEKELEKVLLEASINGKYPVLVDASPCLFHMKETLDKRLQLYEPVEFTLKFLKNRLIFTQKEKKIAVHATCTTIKLGLREKLAELAALCSQSVVVPENIDCCGFAGDRGFSFPELNKSALSGLRDQVATCSEGFSTSKTCEIGLTLHGGITYKSILYLVDRCTEAIVLTREL